MRWLLALVLCLSSVVHAEVEEARARYKKGLAYFALEKYAEAASEYEAAFELEPDPALLYNAAQAHRLAGNKQRALALYQNYLRMFPSQPNRAEVQRHIAVVKAAIESEARARGSQPTDPIRPKPEPRPEPKPKPEPEPKPEPVVTPPVVMVTPTAPVEKKRTKPWVWGVIGGGVVVVGVALGVGLGIGLSGTSYPKADIGSVKPK